MNIRQTPGDPVVIIGEFFVIDAEKVKHEVQVIWSDYFKPEHLAKFPDLHDKVWKLLKLASKNKQNVDAAAAAELVAATEAFAATFVASKA